MEVFFFSVLGLEISVFRVDASRSRVEILEEVLGIIDRLVAETTDGSPSGAR